MLRQLTRLGSQDSITLVFGVRNVSPPSVNRGSHAPDEEDCTLQATTDTKKPTIKTAAGTKGAILAAMITEAERGSLAGRLQTLRFGSKGATIAFVTDGSPLDAMIMPAAIGHSDGGAMAAVLKMDDRMFLAAVPIDTKPEALEGLKAVIETFANPTIGITDEVFNFDHIVGGELRPTRLVAFTLDDGLVTDIADYKGTDNAVAITAMRKGETTLIMTPAGVEDMQGTPIVRFDNIEGDPSTIVNADGYAVAVYFHEPGNGFRKVTFNIETGRMIGFGETFYATPGVRRLPTIGTVWTRPVTDPNAPRGWGYTIAKD